MTVPLADPRLPAAGRLRPLVSQLVQLRPIIEDPCRELYLDLPGAPLELVSYPGPEPDPERPVLFDDEVDITPGITARITVRCAGGDRWEHSREGAVETWLSSHRHGDGW